ncbi:MAG: AsmA family protein [Bacteroidales bacterium]|nr:AsmA family protein [Bacteroidales bacterium]
MKKILKILVIIIVILFITLLFIPFLFKNKIFNLIKEEANKNLKASLNFTDLNLSLIKNFPDLTLELIDFSIIGKEDFRDDTLIYTKKFLSTVNLFSLFSEQIKIKKVYVEQPFVNLLVTKLGKANWDIVIEDTTTTKTEEDTVSSFKLSLKEFKINNASINYSDTSSNVFVKIDSLNLITSGNLDQMVTTLKNNVSAQLTITYDNITVLQNSILNIQSDIQANLDKYEFSFSKTKILLNSFNICFDGIISIPNDDININLNFKNEKSDFKSFLSVVPQYYLKNLDNIIAKGNIEFNGHIKGTYNDSLMPGFALNLKIDKGYIKYSTLPSAIEDINIDLSVFNSNGNEDSTTINLKKFYALFDKTPVNANIFISTPVSNPYFNGIIKILSFNLANIQKFYPLENTEISGLLNVDFAYSATLNDVITNNFKNINAVGKIDITNFVYKHLTENKVYKIPSLLLMFTPSYFELNNLKLVTQQSDFELRGKVTNFLGYLFDKQPLTAELLLNSNVINVNEFISTSAQKASPQPAPDDTSSLSAPELPENIDFTFNCQVKKLIYDKTEFTDAKLFISLKEGKLLVNNLYSKAFNGEVKLSVKYEYKPVIKIGTSLDMKNIDVVAIDKSIGLVSKLVPFVKNSTGKLNMMVEMDMLLTKYLNPILNTLNAKGTISTKSFVIKNSALNNELLKKFDLKSFENIALNDILLRFVIVNGNITIEKQKVKLNNYEAYFEGTQNMNLTCNYNITTSLPSAILTSKTKQIINIDATKVIPDKIPVAINIYDNVNNPKIKVTFGEMQKEVIQSIKEQAKEKINEEAQRVKQEALDKAKQEAEKIIREANEKARIIEEEADKAARQIEQAGIEAANKIREEAEQQAKKVEQQGAGNPITKKAAQESAKRIREEANKKAIEIENKSKQEAQNKRNMAKIEADKIRAEAQAKANKLIENAQK